MIVRWWVLGVTCLLCFAVQGDVLDGNITEIVNNTLPEDSVLQSATSVDDIADNDKGDSEAAERIKRRPGVADILKIDASPLDDSTNEDRGARCSLGSRRRLSKAVPDNADKVAHYFMNGGPTLGQAYFFNNGAYCDNPNANTADSSTSDGSNIVGAANPAKVAPQQVVPVPLTPVYTIPAPLPYAPNSYYPNSQNYYNPITGITNPLAQNPVDNNLPDGILGSLLQSQKIGRTTGNLLQGLVGIPSRVHNWVTQNLVGYALQNGNESNGNYEKPLPETPIVPNSDERYLKNINYNQRSSANALDNIVGSSSGRSTKSSTRSRNRLNQRRPASSQYSYQYMPLVGLANPQPTGYIILPHNPYITNPYNMVGAPYQPTSCHTNSNSQFAKAAQPTTEKENGIVPSDEANLDQKKDSPVVGAPQDGTESEKNSTNNENKNASCIKK